MLLHLCIQHSPVKDLPVEMAHKLPPMLSPLPLFDLPFGYAEEVLLPHIAHGIWNTLTDFLLQFISSRGNEYFCEIDEEYLTDRFNLTGLNTEVQYYQYALDLVTDVFDLDCDDEMRETIEKSARHLYGLVHARYIVTTRGLAKMVCLHTILFLHLHETHL